MKYELSKEQVDTLVLIINRSQIVGEAAEVIVGLKQSLSAPVDNEKE